MDLIHTMNRLINLLQMEASTPPNVSVVTLKGSYEGESRYFITTDSQIYYLNLSDKRVYVFSDPAQTAITPAGNALAMSDYKPERLVGDHRSYDIRLDGIGKLTLCLENPNERIFLFVQRKMNYSIKIEVKLHPGLNQSVLDAFADLTPREWTFLTPRE
jgi:hypothetical protein